MERVLQLLSFVAFVEWWALHRNPQDLTAAIGLLKDPLLVLRSESPTDRMLGDFGIPIGRGSR
jgi:hypothetical protein